MALLITLVLVLCVAATIYCRSVASWAKARMQHLINTRHRDFLKSIQVRGGERLNQNDPIQFKQEAEFFIKIDGKIRPYRSLFMDEKVLSRLNDLELIRLCRKYQKNLKASIVGGVSAVLLIVVDMLL